MGGQTDEQSGGWVLSEFHKNLVYCIGEKEKKIHRHRPRYESWWLILVDHIGVTWSKADQEQFLSEMRIDHVWDKVRVIHPENPDRFLDV